MRPAFSVFTPTHASTYLTAAYDSLRGQTRADWEWILVPNAGCAIPEAIAQDSRVKVCPIPGKQHHIGFLKRYACEQASGDFLVELDHDDVLLPRCLDRIADTHRETGAGFLYSDFIRLAADGSSPTYAADHGWESYPFELEGRTVSAMRAFPPCARSLQHVWWAPNHVRAWTRDAYTLAGKHNERYPVIDDLELLCRTYMTGVPFAHIPEPLYVYREHRGTNGNTYRTFSDQIQRLDAEVSRKYGRSLAVEWSRRLGLPMLDLGGRLGSPGGFITVDKRPGAMLRADALKLPFADSSVGVVRAVDFLEHIPLGKTVAMMNEIHRVLVPGGWLLSDTPSTGGYGAYCDPTHVSFWNLLSFRYYCDRNYQKYVPEIVCRFLDADVWEDYPDSWHEQQKLLYVHADLVALKGQRCPGIVKI